MATTEGPPYHTIDRAADGTWQDTFGLTEGQVTAPHSSLPSSRAQVSAMPFT